jgi:aldehyde dehydrogenase (NAD+)
LGGKSANIVLDDADVQAAWAFTSARSVGAVAGQGRGLPTRMLAHESIHDGVVDRSAPSSRRSRRPVPGRPGDPACLVISQAAADRGMGMIDRAVADGANALPSLPPAVGLVKTSGDQRALYSSEYSWTPVYLNRLDRRRPAVRR